MKIEYGFMVLLLGLSVTTYSAASALETDKQKVSYIMGFQAGSQLQRQGFDIDLDTMMMALKDGLSGNQPKLTGEEAAVVMQKFQAEQEAEKASARAENAKAGAAFLAENKTKTGVIELDNGLQYKVVQAGTGKQPTATDTVTVHYRGTLLNGKEFDSSYSRNEPINFTVNGVIPGWTQILQLMKEGAKWHVVIPSDLAYGPRGAGSDIGPDATLIFDIELIKVN
ncbi:FKBP-type peptidyl-prolyl cis-trans isomerase FkpA precursor [hydrothermal vent metagenome]|uniref:peptidylprolyl isomerase n=1 Tax=hydrothermal vent metagenome TaxID=652676 RepID=A0A3B1AMS3_9ZZZZ